jgi:ABC-2 type transport system permease protein
MLRSRRRSTSWWAIGVAATVGITLAAYPSVRDSTAASDYTKELPEAMRAMFAGGELDIGSGPGYLDSQLFAFTAPLLLLIFAIALGSWVVAGDEEKGTLDLLLAHPVSRSQLVLERFTALAILTAGLCGVLLGSIVAGDALVDLDVGFGNLLAATLGLWVLATLFGAFAIAVGCTWPGRSRAVAITATVAVAAWLLDALGQTVGALDAWRPLSPYYQTIGTDPLRDGASGLGLLTLAGLMATAIAGGIAELRSRDVGT